MDLKALLGEFEEFAEKKQKLLSDTFDFRNEEVPVLQMIDELKPEYNVGDMRKDPVKMLDQQLTNIDKAIKTRTDYIPFLEPFHSIGVHASAFGPEHVWYDDRDPATIHLIERPEEVYDLKPDLKNSGLFNMTLETIEYFQNKVGTSIPISTGDPNGPVLCASLLMQTDNFLMALIENKKEIHHLVDMTTDVFIESFERQFDILKNPALPGHNYVFSKNAKGICVSVDNLAQLPPYIVQEYNVPALERIAARFDGVIVHSCGNWMHNLDTVLGIKGIKGLNFHSSPVDMDPEIVIRKIKKSGKDVTVYTDFGRLGMDWTENYKDEKDAYVNWYISRILYAGIPKGVFVTTYGNYVDPCKFGYGMTRENVSIEQMNEDYDWIKHRIKEIAKEKE